MAAAAPAGLIPSATLSSIFDAIAQSIAAVTARPCTVHRQQAVSGGSINSAYRIDTDAQRYFVKLNRVENLTMFQAEAEGINELAKARAIRVPEPVCIGEDGGQCWLVTEYIEFGRRGGAAQQRQFGQQMADLHRHSAERFGWRRDNTIGPTPQYNGYLDDWVTFYRERRLRVQLQLAERNGLSGRLQTKGERLLQNLDAFFTTYTPRPALLHGDLWGGNYAFNKDGKPVIFDPATYYGDREADIAMTELFGGFGGDFYAAYQAAWPLDDGYSVRKTLYNLYHILNHANLFGGGYAAQAEGMMDRLLSEV